MTVQRVEAGRERRARRAMTGLVMQPAPNALRDSSMLLLASLATNSMISSYCILVIRVTAEKDFLQHARNPAVF